MAEVIPLESHFNHIRTSEAGQNPAICHATVGGLGAKHKKVTKRADITLREDGMDHGEDLEWTE